MTMTALIHDERVKPYLRDWHAETFLVPPSGYGVRFVRRTDQANIAITGPDYEVALRYALVAVDVRIAQEARDAAYARWWAEDEREPFGAYTEQCKAELDDAEAALTRAVQARQATYRQVT